MENDTEEREGFFAETAVLEQPRAHDSDNLEGGVGTLSDDASIALAAAAAFEHANVVESISCQPSEAVHPASSLSHPSSFREHGSAQAGEDVQELIATVDDVNNPPVDEDADHHNHVITSDNGLASDHVSVDLDHADLPSNDGFLTHNVQQHDLQVHGLAHEHTHSHPHTHDHVHIHENAHGVGHVHDHVMHAHLLSHAMSANNHIHHHLVAGDLTPGSNFSVDQDSEHGPPRAAYQTVLPPSRRLFPHSAVPLTTDPRGIAAATKEESTVPVVAETETPPKKQRRQYKSEDERRQARIIKNRRTAEESRQRRLRKMKELEELATMNAQRAMELEQLVAALKAEIADLKRGRNTPSSICLETGSTTLAKTGNELSVSVASGKAILGNGDSKTSVVATTPDVNVGGS